MKIAGRAAVVVGGASGMARATAEMLVREGARVAIACSVDAIRAARSSGCVIARTSSTDVPSSRGGSPSTS